MEGRHAWTEQDSREFIDLGEVFVPERQTQHRVVTSVLPPMGEGDHALDLCCGQGGLSRALLTAFPGVRVVGLDLSPAMLEAARTGLAEFGDRFTAERFDLAAAPWRRRAQAPAAVVSSLAVHHLDAAAKRSLYTDVHAMLAPGGAFVLADLVQPTGERGLDLARRTWDEHVRRRSAAVGAPAAYARFHELRWNCFAHPDPMDVPSPLPDQLDWLRAAGFTEVDVYWMRAGHAVFGGVRR